MFLRCLALSCLVSLAALGCGASDNSKKVHLSPDAGGDVVEASVAAPPPSVSDSGRVQPPDSSPGEPSVEAGVDAGVDGSAFVAGLAVGVTGSGTGAVTSEPAGIDCGTVCEATFDAGVTVVLTAEGGEYSAFVEWEGDCAGQGPVCTLETVETTTVSAVARFDIVNPTLSVELAGDGTGSVLADPEGIDCPEACAGAYPPGSTVTLVAKPDASSEFSGWSGACEGTEPECTLVVTEGQTAAAEFSLRSYELTLTASGPGAGEVTLLAPEGAECADGICTFLHGTEVTVEANALNGSFFIGWNDGACSGTEATCTFVMDGEKTADATFALSEFGLIVSRTGNGRGSVSSEPEGIACAPTCATSYDFGTMVDLTAAPAAGSRFIGWEGCDAETAGVCSVGIDAARQVSAEFRLNRYALTAEKAGNGGGTVYSEDDAIDCGQVCKADYDHGTEVVLVAEPNEQSSFAGWTNCPEADGDECTVTMTKAATVRATFNLLRRALTVTRSGNGSGTVTGTGISCGSDCAESYDHGTAVTLTAAASSDSDFAGWTGCSSTNGTRCTVSMTAARTVSAAFGLKRYTLTAAKSGAGRGTVSSSPTGISCGSDCSQSYDHGARVVLSAAPETGSSFGGWTNCPSASGTTCTVSLTAARTVTASFTLNRYAVAVTRAGTGSGTVTSAPGGISCGSDCSETYDYGTRVVLTASASSGSTFSGWSGCASTSGNECTVTATQARNVTATFTLNRYTLTVQREGSGQGSGNVTSSPSGIACGGSLSDCTQIYDTGTTVRLTASVSSGARFDRWTGCDSASGLTCTVTLSGSKTVTANFTQLQGLTVVKSGNGSGTVTSSPSGINCGLPCGSQNTSFASGAVVVLTATAGSGSAFEGWGGACTGAGSTCTVTMSQARNVTATFTQNRTLTYTATGAGGGTGTVTFTAGGVSSTCTSSCTRTYRDGTSVSVTAVSSEPETLFTGFGGACSGTGNCTIAMNGDRSLSANFDRYRRFAYSPQGGGSGSVVFNAGGTTLTCAAGRVCSYPLVYGTNVQVVGVAPSTDSVFGGFGGDCSGRTCSVSMTADHTITGIFTIRTFRLTVTASSFAASGSVTSTGGGISCGSPALNSQDCVQDYPAGTSFALVASPNNVAIRFDGCDRQESYNVCNIDNMTADRQVSVGFTGVQ